MRLQFLIIFILTLLVSHETLEFAYGQNISTFAGNGSPGYSGGGQATSAALIDPQGIVADAFGNVYLADNNIYRILRIDAAGIITTIAGTGTQGFSGDDKLV